MWAYNSPSRVEHAISQWAFAIRPSSRESTKHCSSTQWLTSTPTAASTACNQLLLQLATNLMEYRTRTLVEYICTYYGNPYTEDCDWDYRILRARCFHSSVGRSARYLSNVCFTCHGQTQLAIDLARRGFFCFWFIPFSQILELQTAILSCKFTDSTVVIIT